MKTFSFIKHRFHSIWESCHSTLPRVQRMLLYYYDENERKVLERNWTQGQPYSGSLTNLAVEKKMLIQKERKSKIISGWTNHTDIGSSGEKRSNLQYSIGDEQENTVLFLKFINPFDGNYDILYLFLEDELSQFVLNSRNAGLSTENKTVIEKLLFNTCSHLLQIEDNNKSVLNSIRQAKDLERTDRNRLTAEINTLKKNYGQSILSFSRSVLERLQETQGLIIKLSDAATEKLMTYTGDFNKLESILENATATAYNLGVGDEKVVIDGAHIVLYEYNDVSNEAPAQRIESKFSKTVGYLDKYEEAAQKLLLKDKSINGKNVAAYCQPSISAAAITINLRAHKENILILLERHPDKWNVLREHFKPVQNLLKDQFLNKAG